MESNLELLGQPEDARLIIIVCDGLGSSNAANHGITTALRTGIASSAALQVPCPWSRGAASNHQGEDVGVSLTVNAEYDCYRWGPITQAPSLLDGDGGFPRTPTDLWEHADVDELQRETRAQIERAILWGFDPSFLHAHLYTLCARPEFFDVYLELAIDYRLPLCLPDPSRDLGFPARQLAADEGICVADQVLTTNADRSLTAIDETLANLSPGVTELHLQPAIDTPELRALNPQWENQVADAHLVTNDWTFRSLVERSGAKQISFRDLRSAQRSRHN